MRACLSPQELTELLSGELNEAERSRRENHIGECTICQKAILSQSGDTALSGYWEREQAIPADVAPPADFLDRLKTVALRDTDAPDQTSRTWPTVPGYEIESELGHGGMAIVYRARQVGL